MKSLKAKDGFTIIEVVLVLAIAGLIFLMVFVALPQLQRSQRDSQRKQDVSRVVTALEEYKANNRGKLPTPTGTSVTCTNTAATSIIPNDSSSYENLNLACSFIATSLNVKTSDSNEFINPNGDVYAITISKRSAPRSSVTNQKRIYIDLQAKCAGEGSAPTSNAKEYAVLLKLEGPGVVCIDNQ